MEKPVYSQIYKGASSPKTKAKFADEEWGALIEEVGKRGQLTDQRKRMIDRLVRERVEYHFLHPLVAKEGAVKKGPNGGDVFNFRYSALQKHADQILKLEEALKLTVTKEVAPVAPKKSKTRASKYLDRTGPR